jgi:hypothetical protein
MIATRRRWAMGVIAGWLVLCSGCGPGEISDKTLPGKWHAVDETGMGDAFKINSASPGAKPSEVMAAAKMLAKTKLDINKDGSFVLQFGVNNYDGSWKLDQKDAMVDFNVEKVNGEPADVKKHFAVAFLGVLDRQTGNMQFVPSDRKIYEEQKKRGDKGLDIMSVRLTND